MTPCRRLAVAGSLLIGGTVYLAAPGRADDWPMFGRDKTRNAVSPEKNPPTEWQIKGAAKRIVDNKVVETHAEDRNVKWSARLGSITTASPVVAGGLVWIGTNNEHPRDPAVKGGGN